MKVYQEEWARRLATNDNPLDVCQGILADDTGCTSLLAMELALRYSKLAYEHFAITGKSAETAKGEVATVPLMALVIALDALITSRGIAGAGFNYDSDTRERAVNSLHAMLSLQDMSCILEEIK